MRIKKTAPDSSSLPHQAIERAIKLSYVQSMLGAIYVASTGGMFIIGFALKLGANNAQIGLLTTVPMACVIVQLLSAMLIERGFSRRRMTILSSGLNAFGWILIILIPILLDGDKPEHRIMILIGIIALITIFGQVANNARASWVGDLIPPKRRGIFFGKVVMYSGIIGAIFAIVGSVFLDKMKHQDAGAFGWLFMVGMAAGLVNSLLFVPQMDHQ